MNRDAPLHFPSDLVPLAAVCGDMISAHFVTFRVHERDTCVIRCLTRSAKDGECLVALVLRPAFAGVPGSLGAVLCPPGGFEGFGILVQSAVLLAS